MMRIATSVALAASALTLAACGSSSTSSGTSYGSGAPAGSAAPSGAAGSGSAAALRTASTSLGPVVVDSHGMTVYVYDQDTPGSGRSACTGSCATLWPPVEVTGTPRASGVRGTLSTIPAADGGRQITLDGRPLYTYAGDQAAGDVTGQGSGGTWWVVGPSGTAVTTAASPSSTAGMHGGGYAY